jgi:hypothetical protein
MRAMTNEIEKPQCYVIVYTAPDGR